LRRNNKLTINKKDLIKIIKLQKKSFKKKEENKYSTLNQIKFFYFSLQTTFSILTWILLVSTYEEKWGKKSHFLNTFLSIFLATVFVFVINFISFLIYEYVEKHTGKYLVNKWVNLIVFCLIVIIVIIISFCFLFFISSKF